MLDLLYSLMVDPVAWLVICACLGVALFQILYTRSHRRNLEDHTRRIEEIYARHGAGGRAKPEQKTDRSGKP